MSKFEIIKLETTFDSKDCQTQKKMTELEMKGKVEQTNINQNTKVSLPLYLQIVILLSVISFTITAVLSYAKQVGKDEMHDEKIIELRESKLDKTTYDKDRSNDKILQELNGKKLDAIMRKLNIENY